MGCMVTVCFIQIPSEGSDIEVAPSPTCLGIGQIWTLISSYQPVLVGEQVLGVEVRARAGLLGWGTEQVS